jgi:fumarate reductase subunit C
MNNYIVIIMNIINYFNRLYHSFKPYGINDKFNIITINNLLDKILDYKLIKSKLTGVPNLIS